jgi:putative aminopeptidase FrvX
MDFTINLLKELTETPGVSGYEAPVRALVRKYLEPYGELSQDKIGSVICRKEGTSDKPRIMLAGHMDEIGFMVKQITPEGFIKFLPLGGWFDQVLLGQRVVIQTNQADVVGVIGAKPPHLLQPDERDKVVKRKDMYIDIGALSKEEVDAAGVKLGDPVIPKADFLELAGGKTYLSKAFDDRIGTALVISAMQELKQKSPQYGLRRRDSNGRSRIAWSDHERQSCRPGCGDCPGIRYRWGRTWDKTRRVDHQVRARANHRFI